MNEFERRLQEILQRQDLFGASLDKLQSELFLNMVASYYRIYDSSVELDRFFVGFQQQYHLPVLNQLANDIEFIFQSNLAYFATQAEAEAVAELTGLVETTLRTSFGIGADEIAQSGLLADVLRDTSIKRDIRTFLGKQVQRSNSKIPESLLRDFIEGNNDNFGLIESYYNRPDRNGKALYDLYQQADRVAQDTFAETLNLNAAIYTGGLIESSRPFCIERNRKVFLRSEIESWKKLNFQGKPKYDYQPIQDCGGINCRHILSWISNATALRLDKTLFLQGNQLKRR